MTDDKLNFIAIPSKGRPRCTTAEYLERIGYPSEWRIVCGDNDNTVDEYIERWGDKVVVFNWLEEASKQDMLDPFGPENSGVITARNFSAKLAAQLGFKRHWQMDDDISAFYVNDSHAGKNNKIEDGDELFYRLNQLAEYADSCGCAKITCQGNNVMFPDGCLSVGWHGYLVMNTPTEGNGFVRYRGRVSEDVTSIADIYKSGSFCLKCNWLGYALRPTMTEKGGSTDLYLTDAGCNARRMAYFTLVAPIVAGADKKLNENGDVKFKNRFKLLVPKVLSEKWRADVVSERHEKRKRVILLGYHTCDMDGKYSGGTEKVTDCIIRYLKDRGYNVLYVCTEDLGKKKLDFYKALYGIDVVSKSYALEHDSMERLHPDLVFVSSIYMEKMQPIFERLVGIADTCPILIYGHGINVCKPNRLPSDLSFRDNVYFASLSRKVREMQMGYGVDGDHIIDIVNMADVPKDLGLNHEYKYDVVSNARTTTQKGIKYIAALCAHMGYKVAFMGGGASEGGKFHSEMRELLGDNAVMLGVLPREQMLKVLSESKFMGFTPNSEEGMPLAVLEAMAIGTPVITWDKVSSTDCVDREHNIVLDASGDYIGQFEREYAPRLDEYLSDENRLGLMEETDRRFGMDAYYVQLDGLIEKVMGDAQE